MLWTSIIKKSNHLIKVILSYVSSEFHYKDTVYSFILFLSTLFVILLNFFI